MLRTFECIVLHQIDIMPGKLASSSAHSTSSTSSTSSSSSSSSNTTTYQFRITGDRFLYHMVRLMVGCLVKVGAGALSLNDVHDALQQSQDAVAYSKGLCAPAQGLVLRRVLYPAALDVFTSSHCTELDSGPDDMVLY
jgi:tRNA U38,U39,U40 pseudouridine synthase TruA